MSAIDRAAEAVLAADLLSHYTDHDAEDIAYDATRAVFESIDTDDLAEALTESVSARWMDLPPRSIAKAVKAHLLGEETR